MFVVVDCWSRTIDRSLLIRRSNRYSVCNGGQSRLDPGHLIRTQRIDHGIGFINAALD